MSFFFIRVKKFLTSLANPRCWRALRFGVAPSVEHLPILRKLSTDGIIDVGGNRGQFALACQMIHPGISVDSFEPIPTEAAVFRQVHLHHRSVTLHETALGENPGIADLHLSQSADSSSLLPIGKQQTNLFANTGEVAVLQVPVKKLDDFQSSWQGKKSQLLKIDVQGFELNVLRGAIETLKTCRYAYVECSEVALYEGQALRPEITSFLASHGFHLIGRFNDYRSADQLIQADYLYERKG